MTGYDFLDDSAKEIRSRWKSWLGASTPDGSLAPVDGSLIAEERKVNLAPGKVNGGRGQYRQQDPGNRFHSLILLAARAADDASERPD